MKKFLVILLGGLILTGCGDKKKEDTNNSTNGDATKAQENREKTVMQDQLFEGLEFVNVGASDGVIKTVVINNTGYVYEGSRFKMIVMDQNGGVIAEEVDSVTGPMETGTTMEIETRTSADLSIAASIEYSIISE